MLVEIRNHDLDCEIGDVVRLQAQAICFGESALADALQCAVRLFDEARLFWGQVDVGVCGGSFRWLVVIALIVLIGIRTVLRFGV